jgi:methyl-accepting chemotaxis protein
VFAEGELAGFVVGRFSPEHLTAIMTNDQQWAGLGETGETYVVASDNRMRSDSRRFLDDRAGFFDEVESAGSADADEIRSTIARSTPHSRVGPVSTRPRTTWVVR